MILPDAPCNMKFVHCVWWEHGMSFGNGLIYHFFQKISLSFWETCSYMCRIIFKDSLSVCISSIFSEFLFHRLDLSKYSELLHVCLQYKLGLLGSVRYPSLSWSLNIASGKLQNCDAYFGYFPFLKIIVL